MTNFPTKIKTIFIGTPNFGLPSLQKLISDRRFEIICVISQPDKKVGRKQIITPPPIKEEAIKHGIKILQPEKIKSIVEEIKFMHPDLIIVAAYAQIIPEDILNIPKYGCINIHGSLLPKYRGSSCVQTAILNGDKKSGITIMKMDKGLDTGPILKLYEVLIEEDETADTLYNKLSNSAPEILIESLFEYINGNLTPQKQDDTLSSYAKQLKKDDGKIDWTKDAQYIERFIRAMFSWPGAFTYWNDRLLKIISTKNIISIDKYPVGQVFDFNSDIAVQCAKGAIVLQNIQIEGKRAISANDFIKGYSDFINSILK